MNDTRDIYAAEWLQLELKNALNKVDECQSDVDRKRHELDIANGWLGQAVAKADAIRLIISMAPLPLVKVTK